jgi:hypothetical protein
VKADVRDWPREQTFATVWWVQRHELESARRSLAMSDSLPRNVIQDLIDTCDRLLAERVRIERILKDLGPAWGGARRALNELHRVLHTPSPDRQHRRR